MVQRICLLLAVCLFGGVTDHGQQASVIEVPTQQGIRYFVLVATQDGRPVSELRQQDFTVFEGRSVRPIVAFRALRERRYAPRWVQTAATQQYLEDDSPLAAVYEITFARAMSQHANTDHSVEIKVDRPNLRVLAHAGYSSERN